MVSGSMRDNRKLMIVACILKLPLIGIQNFGDVNE